MTSVKKMRKQGKEENLETLQDFFGHITGRPGVGGKSLSIERKTTRQVGEAQMSRYLVDISNTS